MRRKRSRKNRRTEREKKNESEARWTYKLLYRVPLWPDLNKSSNSEAAQSNITLSLYSLLLGHISLWESFTTPIFFFFIIPLTPSHLCLCPLGLAPCLPFPFSQPLTIEPFMWPHFETWHGRLERGRGDTERRGEERWRGGGAFKPFLFWALSWGQKHNFLNPSIALPRPSSRAKNTQVSFPPPPHPTIFYTSCLPSSIPPSSIILCFQPKNFLNLAQPASFLMKSTPLFKVHQLHLLSSVFLKCTHSWRNLVTCVLSRCNKVRTQKQCKTAKPKESNSAN